MIIDKNYSQVMEHFFDTSYFSKEETEALVHSMLAGTLSDIRVSAILTSFRFAQITEENILTVLATIKGKNFSFDTKQQGHLVDCSGTGGNGIQTVNISTIASIVAAAAGAKIAKFSGRSLASSAGSFEVLSALDVQFSSSLENTMQDISAHNIAFMPSSHYYPDLKKISHIRKTLGFKTIIDSIFPLSNPAPLTGQLVGIYDKNQLRLISNCLQKMNLKRALVVHGADGLDEITVCAPTYLAKLDQGIITEEILNPNDFGIPIHNNSHLKGKDVEYNAKILVDTLKNDTHQAVIDAVLLNTAAILWCAEQCDSFSDAIAIAKETLKSQKAFSLLEKLKQKSN